MNENIKNFFMSVNQQPQQQQQQLSTTNEQQQTRRSYSDQQIIDTRFPLNQIDNAIIVQSSHIPPLPQTIIQQQAQKDKQYQTNYIQNALNARKEQQQQHAFYDLQSTQQQQQQQPQTFYLTNANTSYNLVQNVPLKINTLNKTTK